MNPTDLRKFPEAVENVDALQAPADLVADAVTRAVPAGPLKDLLSGTWLGHPLHPLLTDLPIGFWTSAWVLDLIGGRRARPAAQRLVALGVLSAIPTAAAGASDFGDTTGKERRVGLVHASANTAALVSFALSWQARRKGKHARGVALGMLGSLAATVGGHLGGHLAYGLDIGADRTAVDPPVGEDWSEAGDNVFVHVDADTGAVHAMDDRCSHRGGPLHEGKVEGDCVECPWHGSRFRLADGEIARGPASRPQPVYETRNTGGRTEVRRRTPSR